MKKMVAVVFLMLACLAFSQDFRSVTWGMSVAEVIQIEGEDFIYKDTTDSLFYERFLLDHPCLLVYLFYEDELYYGSYRFEKADLYDRLGRALTEKYGEPTYPPNTWEIGERTLISVGMDSSSTVLTYSDTQFQFPEDIYKEEKKRDAEEL